MTHTITTRRTRPLALAGGGLALAAALAIGAPLAASAHVTVSSEGEAVAGAYDVLTFAFGHGCDGSPTTALEITLPDGVGAAHPTIQAGWDIEVTRDEADGLPSVVTFTADEPIPDDLRAAVQVQVQFSADAEGDLAFPVEQRCAEGAVSWSEIPEDGQDPHELEAPAPVVAVAAAAEGGDAHAGHGATAEADDATAAPAADAGTAPWAIALGGAGAVLGAAALATSIVALRRRR